MTYWEHRKPVQRLRAVDIQDLARASVRLLDAGGLKALTLRAVAQDIGVAPASLYSRVESVDDLYDLALDIALADDAQMAVATREAELPLLMQCFFTHLTTHRWAGQVIGMRAPRGPAYLALSERMCVLLDSAGVADPLGTAYQLSNVVIGSALTAPMASDEKCVPVDAERAPTYARLKATHQISPHKVLADAVDALLSRSHTM
ncbi:TetR/AcrR family transcriptional regulator [Auritidibacter ignavus]|uniref:TetR/AcrR family transcriptional regulator n=1 Tax=Auritidibacter ignavus TaxID=678932 RepID=UPI00109CF84D|nr:TetR family transcriptional regulator [Auritidibacter ignavus]